MDEMRWKLELVSDGEPGLGLWRAFPVLTTALLLPLSHPPRLARKGSSIQSQHTTRPPQGGGLLSSGGVLSWGALTAQVSTPLPLLQVSRNLCWVPPVTLRNRT